ncbi:reverse transcriptase/maturase family protein [Desulfobacterales bacterium HSG2]|nr:reverse transcriptase/maturase family protein [Desulfobacterales bacterium HSG2]
MKRKGYLFEEIITFENLYEAFRKAYSGSGRTGETCRFNFNLENELLQLKTEIETERYKPARYRYFKIFDPKERQISVAPFRDRVVHHALVRVIEPVFERSFIFDSYATRVGKGTHRAVERAQKFLRKNFWYLKTDVEKYFDSVDHDILLKLIRRKIKDEKVIRLTEKIIRNSDRSRDLAHGKGLPVGNLTSQFFANVYLDPLDHFIKDRLGVKCYIRYMDDMVISSDSKDDLRDLLKIKETFLAENLELRLNPKATRLNNCLHGLPFLGFMIFPNLKRIRKENLKRVKKRLRQRKNEFEAGIITEEQFAMSVRSVFEHVRFADTYRLRRSFLADWAGVE